MRHSSPAGAKKTAPEGQHPVSAGHRTCWAGQRLSKGAANETGLGLGTGALHIDLDAVAANWRTLSARAGSGCETAAVVKADAYGLGAGPVAKRLAHEGVRTFFVAVAEEGAPVRNAVGPQATIFVLAGHMAGDAPRLAEWSLSPVLNSPEQVERHFSALPDHPFAVHLDTGLNRLGLEPDDWRALRTRVLAAKPALVMSHLACADEPGHPANDAQLRLFRDLTADLPVRRSLSATGGILLGPEYGFDLVRPGIGLYGADPFRAGQSAVSLALPVIQSRWVEPGESVGYGCGWVAQSRARIATVSAGYADGLHRRLAGNLTLWAGDTPCPAVGRVSMDLITVDVTALADVPDSLQLLGPRQAIDDLARSAGTIGYELLTQIGRRYARTYSGAVE